VAAVGLIEGLAESTALVSKVFSGALSDYLGRRKGLAVLGYAMGALPSRVRDGQRGGVVTARFIDRVGKGIRGAPRDACWPTHAPAYAVQHLATPVSDTVGAFTGPLLATGLMLLWANDFRAVFWVAVIPGLMAVVLLLVGIQEPKRDRPHRAINPIRRDALARLGSRYWWVVGVGAVFTLARFSEAFLVLRASQLGVPIAWVPLVMVAMNVVYSLSAYPFGKLSDSMSHRTLLAAGLVVLAASDLVLALASDWVGLGLGVALWGVHMGMTQGLLAAMVADTAPSDLRGTAYGFFNLLSGIAMLASSVVAGLMWDRFGSEYTFYAGAAFAGLTLAGMAISAARDKSAA
jgi:MFS family permease